MAQQTIYDASPDSGATFVIDLYEGDLNRVPSSGEIAAWAADVVDGSISEEQLSVAFATGEEATGDITQIYQSTYGRGPTPDELAAAQNSLEAGQTLNELAVAVSAAFETELSADDTFVGTLYQSDLGRTASQGEIAAWAANIIDGSISEIQLSVAFATGGEATKDIIQTYQATYGRAPTSGELATAQNSLENGQPLDKLAAAVAAAAAYDVALSTADTFVGTLYQTDLGRIASPGEIAAWAADILDGSISESSLSVAFATGEEATGDIIETYESTYGRPPTATELAAAQSSLENGQTMQGINSAVNAGYAVAISSADVFIDNLYQADLSRPASASELLVLAADIVGGSLSESQLAIATATGQEVTNDITKTYLSTYGRAPTSAELAAAQNSLENGQTLQGLNIAATAAFEAALSAEDAFVGNLYQTDLGRTASPGEVAAWVADIIGGSISENQLSVAFATGEEATDDIIQTYQETYGRTPTADELVAAQNSLEMGQSLSKIQEVLKTENIGSTSSPENITSQNGKITIDSVTQSADGNSLEPTLYLTGSAPINVNLEIISKNSSGVDQIIGLTNSNESGIWSFQFAGGAGLGFTEIYATQLTNSPAPSTLSNIVDVISAPDIINIDSNIVSNATDGIKANSGHDETSEIQAALDNLQAGQVLKLDPGQYEIDSPLIMRSGQTIQGYGASLIAGANWVDGAANPVNNMFITNASANNDGQTDSNIAVVGLSFNYQSYDWGGTHAIRFVGVDGVNVQDCSFDGGNDGTAFLSCSNTVVNGCFAVNTHNAAFDSWEGSGSALVENSTAIVSGGYGILFDAVATDGTDMTSQYVSAINNNLSVNTNSSQTQAAIWVSPLGQSSNINNDLLEYNTINGFASGIGVDGDTKYSVIAYNAILNGNGPAVFVRNSSGYTPDVGIVTGNYIYNNSNPGQPAEIQISGNDYEIINNYSMSNAEQTFGWVSGENDWASGNSINGSFLYTYNTSGSQNFVSSDTIASLNMQNLNLNPPGASSGIEPIFYYGSESSTANLDIFSINADGVEFQANYGQLNGNEIFGVISSDEIDISNFSAISDILNLSGISGSDANYVSLYDGSKYLNFSFSTNNSTSHIVPQISNDSQGGTIIKFQ